LVFTEIDFETLRFITARKADKWMVESMTRKEAESELEFLETSDDAKAAGLR
jgi:hypothetical protein